MGTISHGRKGAITRRRVQATNRPTRVHLDPSHDAVRTSNGSLDFVAIRVLSGSKGLYPGTRGSIAFTMRNTNFVTKISGKDPVSVRGFGSGRHGAFCKGYLIMLRGGNRPNNIGIATATSKLRGTAATVGIG